MFYTYVGKKGDYIHHIGYEANGRRFHRKESFKPSIYYESPSGEKDSSSITNSPLRRKKFNSISEWYQFYYQNKDILDMFSDLDPIHQFIAYRYPNKITYNAKFIRMWELDIEVMSDDGFPHAHEAKHPIVSISIYDSRRDEYIVLALQGYKYDKSRLPLNTTKVKFKECIDEEDLLKKFIELNNALNPDIWIAHNGQKFDFPYIINRINNIGLKAKDLSPIGKASSKYNPENDDFMSKKSPYYNKIEGISLLDNQLLYKKYIATPRESHSLSNLAVEDLGMDKINYEEYDNLNKLYEMNFSKFIDYNITDVYLMYLLNKKNGYIDIHLRNTYKVKCSNFEEGMSPVKLWDIYVYQSLQKKNIQVTPSKKDVEKFTYPGAFVVPPLVGKSKWVVSFDLNSLYPHIQMEWNISPETLVENLTVSEWLQTLTSDQIDDYIGKTNNKEQIKFLNDLKDLNNFGYAVEPIDTEKLDDRILNGLIPAHPDYIMTANGFYFRKDIIGILPELLIENYNERKAIKKEMAILKNSQNKNFSEKIADQLASMKVSEQGIKIMMNAEYGALANEFFRYCKYQLCSSITMNGQLVLKILLKRIAEKYPNIAVLAGDTDSIMLSLENLVKENCVGFTDDEIITWIDNFCESEIQQLINETYENLSVFVNANQNYMKMTREKIISDAIWTGKKHYAYRMVMEDDVRLTTAKFGFKGLDCVKSSTPRFIRNEQKEAIKIMLTDIDSVVNKIAKSKEAIKNLSPEDIAFPKGCNGLRKYSTGKGRWKKGAQAHVKAALTYNHYIRKNKLKNEYPLIKEGEKIRFVWLKTPNIFNSETFGFVNRLPKDDMIIDFIDYERMYQKSYEKPMYDILEKIGFKKHLQKSVSLEDLF